jgi:hypothetical protein
LVNQEKKQKSIFRSPSSTRQVEVLDSLMGCDLANICARGTITSEKSVNEN